ncbi:MAG TPA: WD40 repeat domain-containing protein [Candidatus Obscuribacterales bacterium]
MSEVQAWRFLVSRNQFLDYRTVVAPDFMCQVNIASLLAKTAEGDPMTDNLAYYREIYGSKSGDLTIIYRVREAQAKQINDNAEGILKDSFGREISFIEGIVLKGIQASLAITLESLEFNHQQLVDDYRDFWKWVSPQPAIPSEARILTLENSTTLGTINLPPHVIGTKGAIKNPLSKNTNETSNNLNESISNLHQEQSFDFNEEVHQCYFISNDEILVYLGASPVTPHDRKVVLFNIQTKNTQDLIKGEFLRRSIESTHLSFDRNTLISSNIRLMGKDEGSKHPGQGFSILPCFLKAYTFSSNSENMIYEGGGEIIAVSRDGKWVINATSNSLNPELFDIKGGGKKLLSGGHKQKITYLASSSHNNVFASGDESGFLRLWSCDTFDSIGGLEVFDSPIDAIAFSPNTRLLVCSGNKGEIKRVFYEDTRVTKEFQEEIGTHIGTKGRKVKVTALAFNCNGQIFASAGDDGSIRLWDISKGQSQDGQLLSEHDKSVTSVSFSPDGKLLASGSKDYTVRIWQLS